MKHNKTQQRKNVRSRSSMLRADSSRTSAESAWREAFGRRKRISLRTMVYGGVDDWPIKELAAVLL